MGAIEIISRQVPFDFFEDPRQKVLLAFRRKDLGVPSFCNTIKNIFHSQEFNAPGRFNGNSGWVHTT